MYTINVPLSIASIKKSLEARKLINKIVTSSDFYNYIANKSFETLQEITKQNLNDIDENEDLAQHYRGNHQKVISDRTITLYNNYTIPVDELSEEIQQNYPNGFNLAKAVEYGIGFIGAGSAASEYASKDGWEYDVNGHGNTGWIYWDYDKGKKVWTSGYEGKLIFLKTKNKILENIHSWIDEYVDKELEKIL